jgi:hypothetical protein
MIKKDKINLLESALLENLYICVMFENFNGFNKFNFFKMDENKIITQIDDGRNDNWNLDNFIKFFFNQYKGKNCIVWKSLDMKINKENILFTIK